MRGRLGIFGGEWFGGEWGEFFFLVSFGPPGCEFEDAG
jgi:hypothetical protein